LQCFDAGFTISAVKNPVVSFKIDKPSQRLVALAKSKNRNLSNYIEKVLKDEIARRVSMVIHARTE